MKPSPSPRQELNVELLHRLRTAGGQYVPLDQLGPEPDRLRDELFALANFGFGIEHHPLLGVAYRSPSPRLCPDQLEFQLGTRLVGHRIAVWNRVTSTNDLAARASRSPANDGLVIMAEDQSAGRGRRGRAWMAPAQSSILMSVLLFPPETLLIHEGQSGTQTTWLTALAAVSVAETVAKFTALQPRIKWPNDVRIAGRKIAGILVERPATSSAVRAGAFGASEATCTSSPVVIGIGLNVNLTHDDFPPSLAEIATSIQIESNQVDLLDRTEVARELIRSLDRWHALCLSEGVAALSAAWALASEHVDQTVRVETHERSHTGKVTELDLNRGLTLELNEASSEPHAHSAKTCLLLPLPEILSLTAIDAAGARPGAMCEPSNPDDESPASRPSPVGEATIGQTSRSILAKHSSKLVGSDDQ